MFDLKQCGNFWSARESQLEDTVVTLHQLFTEITKLDTDVKLKHQELQGTLHNLHL